MWNFLLNVLLVRAHQFCNRDVFVVDRYLETLADHRFDDFEDWAFPQIISTVLETQTKESERPPFIFLQQRSHALNLLPVADHDRVEQWSRNVHAACMIGQGTQILGQA